MPVEVCERLAVVVHQQLGQVAAEAVTHQDALDRQVLAVRRQGVGGHLPALGAQPVGEVEQGEPVVDALLQLPGQRRGCPCCGSAVVDDLERPERGDLIGELHRDVVAGCCESCGSPHGQVAGSCSTAPTIWPPGREKFSANVGMLPPR